MKNITLLVAKIDFIKLCEIFATNHIIIALCSLTSLISFAMTIYVTLKTKSIDKRMLELKSTKDFNRKRNKHISSLETYQTSINEDEVDIYKIRTNILNDVNIIYESYNYILKSSQKKTFHKLIKQLEKKEKIDEILVSNLLSKIIAYMSNSKEN